MRCGRRARPYARRLPTPIPVRPTRHQQPRVLPQWLARWSDAGPISLLVYYSTTLLDPDGGGLEFRRARLRIDRFNGQIVGSHLVVKVGAQERQPRPEPAVKANRRDHR